MFVRIAAEGGEEEAAAGKVRITPYWGVVRDDGSMNPKFLGGAERQAERLRAEGHRIAPAAGKRAPRVEMPDRQDALRARRKRDVLTRRKTVAHGTS